MSNPATSKYKAMGQLSEWEPGEEPEYIYHYTNSSGLMGIINSQTLWATDVWLMNDTQEGTYALDTIRKFLDDCRPESAEMREVCSGAKKIINDWRDRETFIACLSEHGDQLSQWRSYGGGRGYSIGFDLKELRKLFVSYGRACSIHRVVYDTSEQQAILSGAYKESEKALHSFLDDNKNVPKEFTPISLALTGLLANSLTASSSFKNPAFSEEAEVRISTVRSSGDGSPPADLKFRESTLGITPYVTIPLNLPGKKHITVIKQIIVGPQSHERDVQSALSKFLTENGLRNIEIVMSKIPLRT
jgi:hypothetical protein